MLAVCSPRFLVGVLFLLLIMPFLFQQSARCLCQTSPAVPPAEFVCRPYPFCAGIFVIITSTCHVDLFPFLLFKGRICAVPFEQSMNTPPSTGFCRFHSLVIFSAWFYGGCATRIYIYNGSYSSYRGFLL